VNYKENNDWRSFGAPIPFEQWNDEGKGIKRAGWVIAWKFREVGHQDVRNNGLIYLTGNGDIIYVNCDMRTDHFHVINFDFPT
jgi:hypothetical protein